MRISESLCKTTLLTVSMLSLGSSSPLSTVNLEGLRTTSFTKQQKIRGANISTSRNTLFAPPDIITSYAMSTTEAKIQKSSTIDTTPSLNILPTSSKNLQILTTDPSVNVSDYVLTSAADSIVSTTDRTLDFQDRQLKSSQSPSYLNTNSHREHSATFSQRNSTLWEYRKTTAVSSTSSSRPATFSTVNADEVVFLNRNKATTRMSTPPTTIRSSLWTGLSGTSTSTTFSTLTNSSSVNRNNVNTTTQQNEIDFKEVFTAPVFKCPDDHRRDMEGNCKKNYEGYTEKRT